jgi:hypothetical protein
VSDDAWRLTFVGRLYFHFGERFSMNAALTNNCGFLLRSGLFPTTA